MPALNEEEALPAILSALPEWVDRVVIADNGSTDRTVLVAEEGGAEVTHESERGYGAACLAGIEHLSFHGIAPDILVFMDADGSDEPTEIEGLIEPIVSGRADLVLGVRQGEAGDVGTILPHARLGNQLVLGLTRFLFRRKFEDLPPFRAIEFNALKSLDMDDRNWGWTLQMQVRAAVQRLRIEEIGATHRRRQEGHSKISGSLIMSLRVGAKMFYTLGREYLRRP